MKRGARVVFAVAGLVGPFLIAGAVDAHDRVLTDEGLAGLTWCESDDDQHAVNGKYSGVGQFSRPTWDAAAEGAGFPEWVGYEPRWVSLEVQRAVTRWWWEHGPEPSTQWPECADDARRAMGEHAECDHLRNVILPCPLSSSVEDRPDAAGGLQAPVPIFTGMIR